MNCPNCNHSVFPENRFCPSCGASLNSENASSSNPSSEKIKKPSSRLFKIILSIILAIIAGYIFLALTSNDMTNTVKAQLSDIKDGKITEAYYDFTSKAFQKATTLTQFRDFLKNQKEFSLAKSIRFVERNVESNSGILKARLLTSTDVEIPLEYTLIKEDDQWKILNIKLEVSHNLVDDSFNKKPFEETIQKQIELIRIGKFQEAYDNFTSQSFKKATTYKQFEEFVRNQKGFSDNESLVLDDLNFDNNVGRYLGILVAKNQKSYPVEYHLALEDGKWMIMHIEVQKPLEQDNNQTLSISSVTLGNHVDSSGVVTDPKTTFLKDSGDIYLNVHLINGKAGTKIEALLKHEYSDSFIAPVTTKLLVDGNANPTFVFSPPASGWPEGDYTIKLSTLSGYSHSYNFKVSK